MGEGGLVLGSQQADRLLARPCCGHRDLGSNALDIRTEVDSYQRKEERKQKPPSEGHCHIPASLRDWPFHILWNRPTTKGPWAWLLTRTRHLLLSCPAPPSSLDLCNSTQVHCGGGRNEPEVIVPECKLFAAAKRPQRATDGMCPTKGRRQTGPGVKGCTTGEQVKPRAWAPAWPGCAARV